jgi:hypothetical protein
MEGMLVLFCPCDIVTLKRGKIYFDSWFQRIQPMVAWPCYFWAVWSSTSWEHMAKEVSLPHDGWEAKREKGGDRVSIPPSRACLQ